MSSQLKVESKDKYTRQEQDWQAAYADTIGQDRVVKNISGIEVQPLYTPEIPGEQYADKVGFPGEAPYTRGIYPTMHRGRTWTQRQLIGLGTPADYNERVHRMLDLGASAISLIPCNSTFRGVDCTEAPLPLLGTCGTVVNNTDHMEKSLEGVDLGEISASFNDPLPFTLHAFMLGTAKRQGVPWERITGTSNQSDYISHFVANHMFYRLSLPGSRRVLVDHIDFCRQYVPRWNAMSIIGQHMQQAGATPAETMAFTLASGIQHAEDCIARGMDPDSFLPRFTFFFDISISFFEEIAKFRAGRRMWARICKERLGAKQPNSCRFKFHGQTSGVDLTAQQPLNNIARVATQAIVGIFSGLQSMHTDAYDEAIACPSEESARISVATQNILREEAGLCDVIDPLGGSHYLETLTDQMEEKIQEVMDIIDGAGGMYKAVEQGIVQRMIGKSALEFQNQIDSGERSVVGVNCYTIDEEDDQQKSPVRPDQDRMKAHIESFKQFKADRSQAIVDKALDELRRAANSEDENVYGKVVDGAEAGLTHGEIIATLREELGFGNPLVETS